ncbi:MAG: class I SAM-dependent methyltransferase [Pseudomonadota bacterium]
MSETIVADPAGAAELELFQQIAERDRSYMEGREFLARWLFADKLAAQNRRGEMNFFGFDGPAHVWKFFTWIMNFNYPDFLEPDRVEALMKLSAERDQAVLAKTGGPAFEDKVLNVGRYNAQDFLLQRAYPVRDDRRVRRLLDFGGGHGRMANLSSGAPESDVVSMTVVDGIPGPYLTQRAYYRALGLSLYDYLDMDAGAFDMAEGLESSQIVHLPTWRMDLLPDDHYDMVCTVQVLKELPRQLAVHAIGEFARVLKPGGALYIRDHEQFHNPNQLPMDRIIQAAGFVLEFAPHVHDRVDVHGLPRIWRKMDPSLYLNHED